MAIWVRVNTTLKGLEVRVTALEKEFENMADIKEQIAGIKPVLEQVKQDNRDIKISIESMNKDLRDYFRSRQGQ